MDVKQKHSRSAWATRLIATGLMLGVIVTPFVLGTKNANTTFTSIGTAISAGGGIHESNQAEERRTDDGPAWAWRQHRVSQTQRPSSVGHDERVETRLVTSKDVVNNGESNLADRPNPVTARKIIRSGEMEFEVRSFDAAVMTITRLVNETKGGFIATVNSEKTHNGTVHGTVSVRVPPEQLDALLADLRRELGKGLKGQRIGCQDISKQYSDLESRLRAARTMEERLLQVIKTGKGEIKELVEAERELGVWRTKVEEIEGEIRYYANLVALSTLTITLHERGVSPRETSVLRLALRDVPAGYRTLQEAVAKAKGRIVNAHLNDGETGQLDFDILHVDQAAIDAVVSELGEVYSRDVICARADEDVIHDKVRMQISLNAAVNLKPRKNATLVLEVADIEKTMATISATVANSRGSMFLSQVTHKRDGGVAAKLVFDVPLETAAELAEKLREAGRIRVHESSENAQGTDIAMEVARFDVSLSTEPVALADGGLWPQVRKGFSASIMAILWSFSWVGFALVVILPWALLCYCGYRVFIRFHRKPALTRNIDPTPIV